MSGRDLLQRSGLTLSPRPTLGAPPVSRAHPSIGPPRSEQGDAFESDYSCAAAALVDRPVEDVFALIADANNLPLWHPDVAEVRVSNAGPTTTTRQCWVALDWNGYWVEGWVTLTVHPHQRTIEFETDLPTVGLRGRYCLEPVWILTQVALCPRRRTQRWKLAEHIDALLDPLRRRQSRKVLRHLGDWLERDTAGS